MKEREVHLSYADVSQEEWGKSPSTPQTLKVANEARLKEAILALTNLSPEIPSHKVKLATHILAGAGLLDSVDLSQARVAGLTTTRKGALLGTCPWHFCHRRTAHLVGRIHSSGRLDVPLGL